MSRKKCRWISNGILAVLIALLALMAVFPSASMALMIALIVVLTGWVLFYLVEFRCPACGSQTRAEDKFCPRCGAKLEEET